MFAKVSLETSVRAGGLGRLAVAQMSLEASPAVVAWARLICDRSLKSWRISLRGTGGVWPEAKCDGKAGAMSEVFEPYRLNFCPADGPN